MALEFGFIVRGAISSKYSCITNNFILAPSDDLPYTGNLPLPDGYPDVLIPDIAQMIQFNE